MLPQAKIAFAYVISQQGYDQNAKRHTKRPWALIAMIAHGQFVRLMLKLWHKHGRSMAGQCNAGRFRRSAPAREHRHVTC